MIHLYPALYLPQYPLIPTILHTPSNQCNPTPKQCTNQKPKHPYPYSNHYHLFQGKVLHRPTRLYISPIYYTTNHQSISNNNQPSHGRHIYFSPILPTTKAPTPIPNISILYPTTHIHNSILPTPSIHSPVPQPPQHEQVRTSISNQLNGYFIHHFPRPRARVVDSTKKWHGVPRDWIQSDKGDGPSNPRYSSVIRY